MTPYANVNELPITIQDVFPREAQELYLKVYNETWEEYNTPDSSVRPETVAHSLAWDTVNKEFVQVEVGDEKQWYRRGEEPSVEEIDTPNPSLLERIKSMF